ncbi:MAG: response regulator [Rhodospirillales bacterium]|nr:response regulator [Rhodospirillales bacterium]
MCHPVEAPRVLIVEDEPLIAMLVQEWIEELSCTVIGPAASVSGALELIAGAALDGAVLDVSLGNEESFPIADELGKRGVPFVFATGYGGDDLEVRFAGAQVLAKPFEHKLFCEVVKKMLAAKLGI